MNKFLFSLVFLFISLGLKAQEIIIDGKVISNQELVDNYRNLLSADSTFSNKKDSIILEFINEKLKLVDALNSRIDLDPEFQEEFRSFRKELAEPFLLDQVRLDTLIRETYERYKTELKISQIMVKLPQNPSKSDTLLAFNKIQDIFKKLQAGQNFEELVDLYSDDELSKPNKGSLGFLTALQTQWPFEQAMYQLKEGEFSKPFRTSQGYHIIQLHLIRPNSGKIRLAHILVSLANNANDSTVNQAKAKIDEINQYLAKGENFETVCKNFSQDPYSRGRGGEIRKWYFTSDLDENLQEKLFSLQEIGQISSPIRTNLGWHIFKLIDKKPFLPFEEMSEFIKRKILTDETRLAIIKQSFLEKSEKNFGIKLDEEVKSLAFDRIYSDRIGNEPYLKSTLLTIQDSTYSVAKFYHFIQGQQKFYQKRDGFLPEISLQNWLRDFKDYMVIQHIEANLESINPDFKLQVHDFYESSMLSKMTDSMVFAPSLDEKNILQFYQEHLTEFTLPKFLVGKLISASEKGTLDQLVKDLEKSPYPSNKHFPDINYDLNSLDWNENGQILFEELANFLLKNRDFTLEINSHRDPSESEDISFKRLEKFVQAIKSQSIESTRIIEKDLGILEPVTKNKSSRNSRISFKFYSNSFDDVLKRYNYLKPNAVSFKEGELYYSDFPMLENVNINLGKNYFESNNRFYFLNLDKIQESRNKTVDEAKVDIIKSLQDKYSNQWLENCKKKYSIKYNIDKLRSLLN